MSGQKMNFGKRLLARLGWIGVAALGGALVPQMARAAAITGDVIFGDAKISVVNAETNWVDGDLLLVWTNKANRTGSFTLPGLAEARFLVIGGGGAGGSIAPADSNKNGCGGGGGAGGFFELPKSKYGKGTYKVYVGAGGLNPASIDVATMGASGGASAVSNGTTEVALAYGGGGGGARSNGGDGASGGGASLKFVSGKTYEQSIGGTGIQGNNGGSTAAKDPSGYGAGGGGAGAAAADANKTSNAGGDGLPSTITGSERYYAGGGGGGCCLQSGSTNHPGGQGGGGAGGVYTFAEFQPQPGVDGYGGGGGGGGYGVRNRGGDGGCGGVYVRISSALGGPVKPPANQEIVYDGKEHVFATDTIAYYIMSGDGKGTDAGDYKVVLSLKDGFKWEDGGFETGTREVTMKINPAKAEIKNFAQKGWTVGTPPDETPAPTYEINFCGADEPTFAYANEEGSDYSSEKPTAVGVYWLRATVKDDPKGNYLGAVGYAKFSIYEDPGKVFANYVEITNVAYTGTSPKELTNFPYKVTLKENAPLGFTYKEAGMTGENLSVVDAAGNLLPYEVGNWNTKGESVLYVRVPLVTATPQTIRIYWNPKEGASTPVYDPSEVWVDWPNRTVYDTVAAKVKTPSFDDVVRNGKVVNFWVTYPAMDKTEWDADKTPGKLTSQGRLAHGTVTNVVINSLTGEILESLPTNKGGVYRLSFTAVEAETYETPEFHIDIRVVEHDPMSDLKGDAASLTLSGRVLLANDDTVAGHEITDQGYWQQESVRHGKVTDYFSPYWSHEGTHTAYANLKDGVNHMLVYTNYVDGVLASNVIWTLQDVMIGSMASAENISSSASYCYLPYSPTSKMISSYANRTKAATRVEAGTMVMRNIEGAAIYSQCYTNGIGTVYFDAVNAGQFTKNDLWHLAVEVATETIHGRPPTDEYAEGDLAGNLNWRPCPILPLVRNKNATSFTALAVTNDVSLEITTGGTDKNFYRLCATVETRGMARFRIVRTKYSPGALIDTATCFITLDNILVSYPRNTASVAPYGVYDDTLKGSDIVGYGNAMMTPFPAITGEGVCARTKADVFMGGLTNADPSTFIQVSRLHYRWHYLTQDYGAWKSVDLRPVDGYLAETPLDIPNAVGDVEYFFETFTQMPYYEYFDYTGLGYNLKGANGAPLYSEEMAIVTNKLDLATVDGFLPGNNTNWFFRVREGQSDLERYRLVVKRGEDAPEETYDLELAGDNCWRTFVRTPEALSDGLRVRFEAINRQTPGSEEYATNVTYACLKDDVVSNEKPNALVEVDSTNFWSKVVCDAKTGGLVFQIQDDTRAVSVVHADHQDFNSWSDANKKDGKGIFVGKAEYNEAGASGSSAETKTYEDLFEIWHLSNAANTNLWAEPFNVPVDQMGPGKDYEPFKPFGGSRRSPNGLTVGPGMWVTSNYRDNNTGLALQMQGQGLGYLQFVDAAESPRGLESVSFKARLGQAVTFSDFSYWMGGLNVNYTNYTFVTRAAYDLNNRQDFAGNASLSVVAFYQPGVGAYELRVEQEGATMSGKKVTGPNGVQRLTLYRWRYDANKGGMAATSLGTMTVSNGSALTTGSEGGNYGAIFIDIQSTAKKNGVTYVRAGITRDCKAAGNTEAADSTWVWFNDTDDSLRLKWGTYGVLCANCPGRFVTPYVFEKGHSSTTPWKASDVGFKSSASGTKFTFPTTGKRECYDELIVNGEWAIMPWRMAAYETTPTRYGLKFDPAPQAINIYTAAPGSTDWKLVATTNIVDFGTATSQSKPITMNFWSKDDCSVKIAPGGDSDTARNDVVIDDFEITQWRGESYDDAEGAKYFKNVYYGSPTNIVFTQAWILTNKYGVTNCQLSAKRSLATVATSIRSPLMDGMDGRGIGLGMFTFTYENAQKNARLLMQVCTNDIDMTALAGISKSADNEYWTTVTNYDFATLPASGQLSHYFGLHGAVGAMRIVVDPALVKEVENETDPAKFGSIDITGVVCRDEPELDETSWWGWNLRTTEDKAMMNIADVAAQGVEDGMVVGLNNSISKDTRDADESQYSKHYPFVQSPLFGEDIVGEVVFKARKYAIDDPGARITLYGANGVTAPDDLWTRLTSWTVTNTTFKTFGYKTAPGENYRTFRFVVTGVDGVIDPKMPDERPLVPPYRVLMDDVLVLEAIRTRVGFKNVAAFRNHLDTREEIADILDRSEQPLCREAWGVQAEIFATQLAEEADLSTAKVRLWWYDGVQPWGFKNWKEQGRNAWLTACEGATNVFRSSYFGAPGAVMSAKQTPGTVQYMLEVQYRTTKGEMTTNWLEQADWPVPAWYNPIDYNAKYGEFSAFNILDTVSPGWAWINELNLYGEMDANYENSDKPLQFVEIAAPSDADLTSWTLRFLYANSNAKTVTTNEVATFGSGSLPGLKQDLKGLDADSGCVFHVIGSPYTLTSLLPKPLTVADGTLDGVWSVKSSTSAVYTDGEIQRAMPIAVQLVRPSGVIAHEIVAIGTNRWESLGGDYLTETQVNELNADERRQGGQGLFFDAGMDAQGIGTNAPWSTSLGVSRNNGLTAMDWTGAWGMTPGRRNEFQDIPGKPPKPLGTSLIVYSQIEGGHLRQTFADAERTNITVAAVVPKGETTNITYFADRWYQVGAITTNGVTVAVPPDGTREFVLTVGGEGISNDFTVVARETIDGTLQNDYGLGPENPYRLAVMDWLTKGVTKRGPFANVCTDLVGLADYCDWNGEFVTNLTLTSMYWLDMDPTWNAGDLQLRGQIGAPSPIDLDGLTNRRMTVSLMITNTAPTATDKAWAPYILRGLEPDSSSWDYAAGRLSSWTSVTFKVTGILVNGGGDFGRFNYQPLRWFVFNGTAGGVSTSFDENYTALVDIVDPHSSESPGALHHWDDHPECDVWFQWDIDDRLLPMGVEVLKPENKLSD